MDDKIWIRMNGVLRFIMIIVLIWIGIQILYNKFGYEDPDDSQISYDLGNLTLTVTCRDALYYYADKEWHIYERKNISYKYPEINISKLNLSG
jgi:hypothetical protein